MFAALLLSLAVLSGGVGDQDDPPRCTDGMTDDQCIETIFAPTLADLPVRAIADEANDGAEIYRVRVLDAWRRTRPMVSFERRPGRPPAVVVRDVGGGEISAPVSPAVWRRVAKVSAFADRDLVERPPAPPADPDMEEIVVCADGLTYLVEMANASAGLIDTRPVRRKMDHTCGDTPTTVFAETLMTEAVAALPACTILAAEDRHDDTGVLRECLSLRGDTLAAAELMKAVDQVPFRDQKRGAWDAWLRINRPARLDWAGQMVTQAGWVSPGSTQPTIAGFLADQVAALKTLHLYVEEVGADSATQGWVKGQVVYFTSDDDDGGPMAGVYRQVWSRTYDEGEWSLVSWTVEPFKREE